MYKRQILDYGHNPEAFEELFYLANNIKRNKIISIVSSPGDRLDEYIKELGKIAGKNSDTIIIKETFDRRGREELEITNLIKSGINEVENKSVEVLSIICLLYTSAISCDINSEFYEFYKNRLKEEVYKKKLG